MTHVGRGPVVVGLVVSAKPNLPDLFIFLFFTSQNQLLDSSTYLTICIIWKQLKQNYNSACWPETPVVKRSIVAVLQKWLKIQEIRRAVKVARDVTRSSLPSRPLGEVYFFLYTQSQLHPFNIPSF